MNIVSIYSKIEPILIFLKNVFFKLCDCVYPPICASCKIFLKRQAILCTECERSIQPVVSKELAITKTKKVCVFSIGNYTDPLKSLILAKGYSDVLAAEFLGALIWEKTLLRNFDFDVIIPIPLHWSRRMKRGYNQAEHIATIISKKSKKPCFNLLKRTRRTPFQSSLSIKERQENVKNVFSVHDTFTDQIQDKHIVLVDDLMTTGETIRSACKELLKYKPNKITVVVAARVL